MLQYSARRPADLAPFNVEALTSLLRDSGRLPKDGRVTALRVTKLSTSGLVGTAERIYLDYDPSGPSGPSSLIFKSSSPSFEEGPKLASVELRFYRDAVPHLPTLPVATVFYRNVDRRTGHSCLLLEDLGDDGFVRQIDGCTETEARTALSAIATMHARWWDRALPSQLSWIKVPRESVVGAFCGRWLRAYAGEWPDVLSGAPVKLLEAYDRIAARLAGAPRTVVHGDFHSENVFIDVGGGQESVRFIDFQFVQHACGPLDVSRFLATSLRSDVRRKIEIDLIRVYHQALLERGIQNYSFDRCLDDVRAAFPWNLTTPLALHVMRILTKGGTWPDRLPMLERCLTAIADWRAWDPR